MLIQNFLLLLVHGLRHFDFNLQYLEVASRFFEDGIEDGIANDYGDAATNPISNPHSHSQPQIQTAYISPVSTH